MQNKNLAVIVGLGQTGLSCARYLHRHNIAFAVTDSRPNPPGVTELKILAPEVKTCFGELAADLINSARCLVISPGISLKTPVIAAAIQQGIEAIGDIELFARMNTAPVVGITGANG